MLDLSAVQTMIAEIGPGVNLQVRCIRNLIDTILEKKSYSYQERGMYFESDSSNRYLSKRDLMVFYKIFEGHKINNTT